MVLGLAAAPAIFALLSAHAQGPKHLDPIEPDRPDYSNGIAIVPFGHPQLEVGYRQILSPNSTVRDYGDGATLRIGVNDRFEWRFGIPSFISSNDGSGRNSGFGDGSLGAKWKLSEGKGRSMPGFGLLFTASVPSGSSAFREKRVQPEARLLVDWQCGASSDLTANLVLGLPSDNGDEFTEWAASASYEQDLGKGNSAFMEGYSLLPGSYRGPNESFIDAGVAHLLSNDVQVDASFGRGLNGRGRDSFFGAGVAIRF